MIEPENIPLFTGDLGQLDNHVRALRCHADDIRQAGGDADRRFHGLSAFYQAPEADALFASTGPARDAADSFADKVATVADALSAYAIEVAPIIKRLEALKSRAAAFVASLPAGHDQYGMDWTHDADKVHEDQALMHEVNVAQAQFAAAEVACNNKITALVGGTQYVINTGSRQLKPIGAKFYGYSPDVLDHAKELPWGTSVSQSHTLLDPHDYGYYLKSFVWDGLIVDNVWGTFDGFSALFGANGPQAFKDSWKGMFRVMVGAQACLMDSGGRKSAPATHDDYIQGSKAYAKEFAKSLVAWDQWKENPARAAATVVFNGLTLGAGPLKAASAGKAGTAAKAAATVAKIGEAIDPVNATTKVAGRAIPKIAEVTANLRGANSIPELHTPHSVLQLSDGSKLVIEDGRFLAYDKHGDVISETPKQEQVVNADGTLHQHAEKANAEISAADRAALDSTPRSGAREPELVGAHAAANSVPDAGRASEHVAGNGAQDLGQGSSTRELPAKGVSGASAGSGDDVVGHHGGSGTEPGYGEQRDGATGEPGPEEHNADHGHGDDGQGERQQELSPAERKAIQDEHVRKANEDPEWFKDHYDILGRRKPNIGPVDGVALPQIARDPWGRWVAKHDLPSGPSEVRLGSKPLPRGTVSNDVLPTLDRRAADRQAYRHLMNAQKAFDDTPSIPNHEALTNAQQAYAKQLGDVPPNSKISEKLGEDASKLHAIPHEFPDAEVIELPKTPNGANMFDAAYRIKGGGILIVEDKAPGNDLDWRRGRADPEDPANPHVGDDGGAAGLRVKQGTLVYLRTIMAEMRMRGGRDAQLAREFRNALKAGKLRYVLVKAEEPDGSLYAGAVFEEMQLY